MSDSTRTVIANGDIEYRNVGGQLHRLDGPAFEYTNGTRLWYVDGRLHRLDGPAIEYPDGTRAWFFDGKLHRTDGPAVESTGGDRQFWIDGQQLTEDEFKAHHRGRGGGS